MTSQFWPNGARLALSIVVNIEEGSELSVAEGDRGPEPVDELGVTLKKALRNYGNESNYQYAMTLCMNMGRECDLVAQDWSSSIPAFLAKTYDAIVASMPITEERKKRVDFSNKYDYTPARFVAAEGTDFEAVPRGMAGKTVGVRRGAGHRTVTSPRKPQTRAGQPLRRPHITSGRDSRCLHGTRPLSQFALTAEPGFAATGCAATEGACGAAAA